MLDTGLGPDPFVLQVGAVRGPGGINTAAVHYARMLKSLGISTTAAFRGPAKGALISEGADVIDVPLLLKSPLGRVPWLLHTFQRAVLARAAGRRIVLIVHSDLVLPTLRSLFPNAIAVTPCHSDKLNRKLRSDLILTLNPSQHERVRRALPRARVALLGNPYVGNGVPLLSPPGPPRINFIGRFIPDKDPLCLLQAARLVNGHPDLEFRFIGAGSLEAKLRGAAASGSIRSSFAGWVSAPFGILHQNDILVAPSIWEGLPYLLHEALDNGVPVIASDVPGHRAALDEGRYGLLFPKRNAAALAGSIETALSNLDSLRVRARLGGAAVHARYGARSFWSALGAALADLPSARVDQA